MKLNTYTAVFFEKDGKEIIRWVTSTQGSQFYWDAGKPAMKMPDALARDIVYGGTLNGYRVALVKMPGAAPSNP